MMIIFRLRPGAPSPLATEDFHGLLVERRSPSGTVGTTDRVTIGRARGLSAVRVFRVQRASTGRMIAQTRRLPIELPSRSLNPG
jgi:hypothetical protein